MWFVPRLLVRAVGWLADQVLVEWQPWSGLVLALGLLLVWRGGRAARNAEDAAVAGARWLEIVPPARMPIEGAEALPRTLVGVLSSARVGWVRPRLALEVFTDGQVARLGVWVPGNLSPRAVAAAITRGLPGCRVNKTDPPLGVDDPRRAGGRELRPDQGPWSVLVDPAPRRGVLRSASETGEETLRSVLTTVTSSPVPACLQLVITTANSHRRVRGGPREWRSWGRPALYWACRALMGALLVLIWLARELVTAFTESNQSRTGANSRSATGHIASGGAAPARKVDPVLAARQREWEAKRAAGPLSHVTLRVATLAEARGHRPPAGSGLAREVAAGYALAMPRAQLIAAGAWRFERGVSDRRRGRGFYATLTEIGALWHLPAEPSRYNLPDAAARNRPGRPGVPRLRTLPTAQPSDGHGTGTASAPGDTLGPLARSGLARRYPGIDPYLARQYPGRRWPSANHRPLGMPGARAADERDSRFGESA